MLDKSKILERYKNKEERILASNALDKAYSVIKNDKICCTNFLNLSEQLIFKSILDKMNIPYELLPKNKDMSKKMIFLKPSYISNLDSIIDDYIVCLKVVPQTKTKENIKHKDYMGSIYALGIKRETIGDIIVKEGIRIYFCYKKYI